MSLLPDPPNHCWSQIGTSGDRSCPELLKWSLCQNCPVFVEAGQELFEGAPPAGYLAQWTELLAADVAGGEARLESLLVFTIRGEWLALPTRAFLTIDDYRNPRPVPHRTNGVFLGLVAVEGRIHLCVDLGEILGIQWPEGRKSTGSPPKLAIVEENSQSLAFPVEGVLGVYRFDQREGKAPPASLTRALPAFTERMFRLDDKQIGLLALARILGHLQRNILA